MHTFAELQAVQPIDDLNTLLGGWPEDDFITTIREWREQNLVEVHAESVQDAWIAATALRHGCSLVTHNRSDFADITGLTVISES